MNDRLLFRIYRLRARLLKNILALMSLSAVISACSNSSNQDNAVNQDSKKEIQSSDSVYRADSIAKAEADSIALKHKKDSLADANKQPVKYIAPVIPPDYGPICEYGVEPVYEPDPMQDQPMYGVPVPDQIQTKYGVPVPGIPEQIQTKYGVPRN